jgi:hypothetical protein
MDLVKTGQPMLGNDLWAGHRSGGAITLGIGWRRSK